LAGAAFYSPPCIKSAATEATNVHGAREPICYDPAQSQDCNQYEQVQRGVPQLRYFS
jgi:hypothetical protein